MMIMNNKVLLIHLNNIKNHIKKDNINQALVEMNGLMGVIENE